MPMTRLSPDIRALCKKLSKKGLKINSKLLLRLKKLDFRLFFFVAKTIQNKETDTAASSYVYFSIFYRVKFIFCRQKFG